MTWSYRKRGKAKKLLKLEVTKYSFVITQNNIIAMTYSFAVNAETTQIDVLDMDRYTVNIIWTSTVHFQSSTNSKQLKTLNYTIHNKSRNTSSSSNKKSFRIFNNFCRYKNSIWSKRSYWKWTDPYKTALSKWEKLIKTLAQILVFQERGNLSWCFINWIS